MFGYAVELSEPTFGVDPDTLNAVDVAASADQLAPAVLNAQVVLAADVDQAVVATQPSE